jgi:hypothetical protein
VQRDVAPVGVEDVEALLDQGVALGLVGLALDLVGDLVDLRIAVAREVPAAAARLVAGLPAADDLVEDIVAVQRGRGPAEQVERGVVVRRQDLGEVLGLRLGVEVHLDVDARQHRDHRLADRLVVDVAVVRAIHGQREPVRVAGLGHQLLGLLEVGGRALELGAAVVEGRGDHQRGGHRLPAHHALGDRVLVDGEVEGLTHLDVLERVLALDARVLQLVPVLVHAEEDRAQLGPGHHGGGAAGIDPLLVLQRHGVDPVNLAGEQRGDAGCRVGDGGEDRLVEVRLDLAPVAVELLEHGPHAGLVLGDHERAGAVLVQGGVARAGGVGRRRLDDAVLLGPRLRHDHPGRELGDGDGVRLLQHHVDGEVVDLYELGVGRDVRGEVRARGPDALGGEEHVVGGEGRAVVELDVLAQVEAPASRLGRLPGFGQGGREFQVLVEGDEGLVGRFLHAFREALLEGVRVEGFQVTLEGEAEDVGGLRGQRGERERRDRRCGHAAGEGLQG